MNTDSPAATLHAFAVALVLAASAAAADLVVDASGAPGTYPTVQAAIVAAQPGDRILVAPGVYPAFTIPKSITILGLGGSPGDVVVGGVHFGLGFPNQNYLVRISRLRVDAGPVAPQAISGQEMGVGQIEFDSVEVAGGCRLLAGEAGFVLSLANCRIVGDIGQGFDGATCHVAAPAPSSVSFTRCVIQGGRGDLFGAQAPLAGLLLDRGITAAIARCEIHGGDGDIAQAGAPGLDVRQGQVRTLGTGAVVQGGDGGAGAMGGPGVRTNSTVQFGTATIFGGLPNGPVAAGPGAVLPAPGARPELSLDVAQSPTGPAVVTPGTLLDWHLQSFGMPGVTVLSFVRTGPQPAPSPELLVDPGLAMLVPDDATISLPPLGAFVGLPVYLQGLSLNGGGQLLGTAPHALRLDG